MRIALFILLSPLLASCQTEFLTYLDNSRLDLRLFGAKLDGVNDDTDVFNAALDSISTSISKSGIYAEGVLTLDGDRIDWRRCNNCSITIYISGTLKSLSSIRIPSYVSIIGLGGYRGTQFGLGPTALVTNPPTGPAIIVEGVAYNELKNLTFQYNESQEGALSIGYEPDGIGAALVTLENIGVQMPNNPTAVGIKMYSTFWVWMKNVIVNGQANSGPTIHIRGDKTVNGNNNAYHYFYDVIYSYKGILVDAHPQHGCDGLIDLHISRGHMENRNNSPMITFDMRRYLYSGNVVLSDWMESDLISAGGYPRINVIGKLKGLTIDDWGMEPVIGGLVNGLKVSYAQDGFTSSRAYQLGPVNRNSTIEMGGEIDGRITTRNHVQGFEVTAVSGFHPAVSNENMPNYSNQNVSITSGHLSPAFDNTALRVDPTTTANGNQLLFLPNWYPNPKDSSLLIVGAWVKSIGESDPMTGPGKSLFQIAMYESTAQLIREDGDTSNYITGKNTMASRKYGGWIPVVNVYRVLNPDNDAVRLETKMYYKKDAPFYLWRPFVGLIQNGSELNDVDLARLANSLTTQQPGIEQGVLYSPAKGLEVAGFKVSSNGVTYNGEPMTKEPIIGDQCPIGNVTPQYIGQDYFSTDCHEWYKAFGLTPNDWNNITPKQ
jgi:hypothetical protein